MLKWKGLGDFVSQTHSRHPPFKEISFIRPSLSFSVGAGYGSDSFTIKKHDKKGLISMKGSTILLPCFVLSQLSPQILPINPQLPNRFLKRWCAKLLDICEKNFKKRPE